MKVLQINAVCGTGSTGRICTDIAEQLKKDGHEVKIIYGNGNCSYADSVRVGTDASVKMNALYARVSGMTAHAALRSTRHILQLIQSFSPDIVHLHNLHANYVNIATLLKYLAEHRIATVITLHDCWPFTGKCTHYTSVGCLKWKSGCGKCPKLKDDIPSFFFDRTHEMWEEKRNGFDRIPDLAVIGVSDWITAEAQKSFLGHAKIVKRIYNWIDLDIYRPEAGDTAGAKEDKKFTIFCASAGWQRDSDRLNDLLALSDQIDPSMQIVAAGNMDGSVDLPANVIPVGYIADPEMLAAYYRNADVYVHLSREDTFGKVIAEALACGTPAIVYHATACPEIVGSGCGYVVECGNTEAIASECSTVMKAGKAAYAECCAAFARDHFGKETLIRETIALYESLLQPAGI